MMEDEVVHMNFCRNLRHLRRVYHLTQAEMARCLEISVGKLRKIEKLDQCVKLDCYLLWRVSALFHVSADDLLDRDISCTSV